jgi:Na+-translocating ferredoxin:NAD+ oxidoreductase RnfA subunit
VIGSAIRIAGILLLMPKMGLDGYLLGLLTANCVVTVIAAVRIHQLANVHFHALRDVLLPACASVIGAALARRSTLPVIFDFWKGNSLWLQLAWNCGLMTLVFLVIMSGGFAVKKIKKN